MDEQTSKIELKACKTHNFNFTKLRKPLIKTSNQTDPDQYQVPPPHLTPFLPARTLLDGHQGTSFNVLPDRILLFTHKNDGTEDA